MRKLLLLLLVFALPVAAQTINPNQIRPGTYQNGTYTFPGTLAAGTANVTGVATFGGGIASLEGINIQGSSVQQQAPNDTANGTVLNEMACYEFSGKVGLCSLTATNLAGLVTGGATGTTAGNTIFATLGKALGTFDGTATVGDCAVLSTTTYGYLHDSGQTCSGLAVGTVFLGCSGAGCIASVNLSIAQVFGAGSVTANAISSSAFSAGTTNGVIHVEKESGSTADAQIAACFSALSATGGICDATGYSGSSPSWAATLTLHPSAKVTLLCDPATLFTPTSATLAMLIVNENVDLDHCTFSVPSNYSATAINAYPVESTAQASLFSTELNDVSVKNLAGITTQQYNTGTALSVIGNNTAAYGTAFIKVNGFTALAMHTGLNLAATGGGYVNANIFSGFRNIYVLDPLVMSTDSVAGSQVAGNNLPNWVSESPEPSGTYQGTGITYSGTQAIQHNEMLDWQVWDYPALVASTNPNAKQNFFIGQAIAGGPPPSDNNYYCDTGHSLCDLGLLNLSIGEGISISQLGNAAMFTATNTLNRGASRELLTNDQGMSVALQMSGSTYGLNPTLENVATLGSAGPATMMLLQTNGDVGSGGTTPIGLQAGGINVPYQMLVFPTTNDILFNQNTTTDPGAGKTVYNDGNYMHAGTINQGTWNGTAITPTYGGTGIDTHAATGCPTVSGGTWSITACSGTGGINQLTGDVTAGPGTGSQAATVVKVNGGVVPVSKTVVGTNASGQIVDASSATLSNNTTGNAATATQISSTAVTVTASAALTAAGGSAVCNPAVTCTSKRGLVTVVGGTFTTGEAFTLTWTATPTPMQCEYSQNGAATEYFFGDNGAYPTTTGATVGPYASISGATVYVRYSCQL